MRWTDLPLFISESMSSQFVCYVHISSVSSFTDDLRARLEARALNPAKQPVDTSRTSRCLFGFVAEGGGQFK